MYIYIYICIFLHIHSLCIYYILLKRFYNYISYKHSKISVLKNVCISLTTVL